MALRAYFDGEVSRLWVDMSNAPGPPNAMVLSFSATSFLVDAPTDLQIGAQVEVIFSDTEIWRSRISWSGPGLFGCLFCVEIPVFLWDVATKVRQRDEDRNADPMIDRRIRDLSLGARLRRLRTKRGLRQDAIASALGVSTATISYWESDRAQPKPERLVEIAAALDVPLGELTAILVKPGGEESTDPVEALREQFSEKLGVAPDQLRILVEITKPGLTLPVTTIRPISGRR